MSSLHKARKPSKLYFMSLLKKVAIIVVAWVVCVLIYLEFFSRVR